MIGCTKLIILGKSNSNTSMRGFRDRSCSKPVA